MGNTKLGLPLEYQRHPEFFDAFSDNGHAAATNTVIAKLLRKQKVRTVLDMTCGTGSQVWHLAKHGYKVTGADFSPALLRIARAKARIEKMPVEFIDGDMRTLQVGAFDAVITIANAVGHLTKAGFEKSLRNIGRNLKPGGVYIFDIFNLDAMTDTVVADFAMHWCRKSENTQCHNVQCSVINRRQGRLTSYDHYVFQKGARKPQTLKSRFSLQLYTAKELRGMLARNGFDTLMQCGLDGSQFVSGKTTSILTMARRC